MECIKKLTECISDIELDEYLAEGWYRLHQSMFTTDEMYDNSITRLMFWLRVNVPEVVYKKKQKRIYKKTASFSIEISDWCLTEEIEKLWEKYIGQVNFFACGSAEYYLLGDVGNNTKNCFNTKMITIRDNGKLIAVGYFDIAGNSVASILHFYDHDYKKYSLGKYLMLLEVDYARQHNKEFYYTGYIAICIDKFDYKLFCDINATEVYLPWDDKWVKWNSISKEGLQNTYFGFDDELLKELDELALNKDSKCITLELPNIKKNITIDNHKNRQKK